MIQVRRLGHATFATPDLERQVEYWRDVIGLQLVDRTKDTALFATRLGQEAIALERGAESSLKRLSFQVAPGSDLGELVANLQGHGVATERRQDISPGVREAIFFTDPKGTLVEVFAEYEFHDFDSSDAGISPLKFGHVAYRVEDVQKLTDFYSDVLGFRVSDWVGDHFSFMRCGMDHHTVNFVRSDAPMLHHIAFEVKDWAALQRSCEVLTRNRIPLVWGPLRHIVGHNIAAYHRSGDNVRVEMFCEMDQMRDEALGYWDPRPWHQEAPLRPKRWPKDTWRSQWGFGSNGQGFEGHF
jgi:catechol 2,3-dioxygenase-like lactoylglutathione lyase family enzyme